VIDRALVPPGPHALPELNAAPALFAGSAKSEREAPLRGPFPAGQGSSAGGERVGSPAYDGPNNRHTATARMAVGSPRDSFVQKTAFGPN
jgi:hypothetical protein